METISGVGLDHRPEGLDQFDETSLEFALGGTGAYLRYRGRTERPPHESTVLRWRRREARSGPTDGQQDHAAYITCNLSAIPKTICGTRCWLDTESIHRAFFGNANEFAGLHWK